MLEHSQLSQMTPEQLHEFKIELKDHIGEVITLKVNGKIDKIDAKLTEYIKDDIAWKLEYEPYIKGLANVSGAMKIGVAIALGISAVIGAFISLKNLFHWNI